MTKRKVGTLQIAQIIPVLLASLPLVTASVALCDFMDILATILTHIVAAA